MKTTHIGSLPYKSIRQAVDFNLGLSLPALPMIPRLFEDEWMINQFSSGFMNADHELSFSCFDEFFKNFQGKVKVQVCGILTLFNNAPKKNVSVTEYTDWYLLVLKRFLAKIPTDYILFFDEPDLRNFNKSLWDCYSGLTGIELGLHCCASLKWSALDLSSFNHISFDQSLMSKEDLSYLNGLNKTLYYGVYDTHTGESLGTVGEDQFLSPKCGLALSTDDVTETIRLKLSSN